MNATLEQNTQQKTHSEKHQEILQGIFAKQLRLGVSTSNFLKNPKSLEINPITINSNKLPNNSDVRIIAYCNYFASLFQLVHKKRSKLITLIFSQLFYMSQKTNENYEYTSEEMNNFLYNDKGRCTYKHGYITGYKFQDIANICGTNKSTISKYIADFESCGYLTKITVTDDITDIKYKTDERIRIRLNLVNIFKDLVSIGLDNLDEKENLLPAEYLELYTYIKHVILHLNNTELIKKHSVDIDINKIDTEILVNSYAKLKGEVIGVNENNFTRITINKNLKIILEKYDISALVLALDNYELYRYMSNKYGQFIFKTSNFFKLENIENFIEPNFNDYLITQGLIEPSENKIKAGYKTISQAQQIQFRRKLREVDPNQIIIDCCVHKLRHNKNNTPASVSNVIDTKIKQFVDDLFLQEKTKKAIKKFWSCCYHKDKLDNDDLFNQAYVIAIDVQAKNSYSSAEELLNSTLDELKKLINKEYTNAAIKNEEIIDFINETEIVDISTIFHDKWNVAHIFDLEHSNKKVLYQVLFCLVSNDKVVSTFANEYRVFLDKYFFDLHNTENKIERMRQEFGYNTSRGVIERIKSIMSLINQNIVRYTQIKEKPLCELIADSDLLTNNDYCTVRLINSTNEVELPISAIFDNDNIANISQIVSIPALHNKTSELYKLLVQLSYEMNHTTITKDLTKRIK